MKNYRLLATYSFPYQYFLLRNKLEEAGIRHCFQHETLTALLPINAIQLLVHEQDLTKAKEIMDSLNDNFPNLRIV